jgi:hypothetical protein
MDRREDMYLDGPSAAHADWNRPLPIVCIAAAIAVRVDGSPLPMDCAVLNPV